MIFLRSCLLLVFLGTSVFAQRPNVLLIAIDDLND